MTNKNNLDELIYISMKIEDKPTKQLNDNLKVKIYEKENMQDAKGRIRAKYFIYLFMSLNVILAILIGILATIIIKNQYLYIVILISSICYIISTIVVTFASLKLRDFREVFI